MDNENSNQVEEQSSEQSSEQSNEQVKEQVGAIVLNGHLDQLLKMLEYFQKEYAEEKIDFHVRITSPGKGHINPQNKNGDTFDFDFSDLE